MNFTIYTYKIAEKFHKDAIKEYQKRLSRYCKIKLIELKTEKQLQNKLKTTSYKIRITPTGDQYTSEEFAKKINYYALHGKSDLELILLDAAVDTDEEISLSKMGMDAGLTTVIVFEQIYRAYRILNNEPYHK